MPYLQEPEIGTSIRYARSDHTIPIPRPAFDSAIGVTSACKLCHASSSEAQLEAQVRAGWGELKPHPATVDALVRLRSTSDRGEASRLALDTTGRHRAAQFTGLADFLERFVQPDMSDLGRDAVERLETMAASADLDVRATSLAALHYAQGQDKSVRRFLIDQMKRFGADDRALRGRWVLVLGYFGDRALAKGDPGGAETAYHKALEVMPNDPRVLLKLGLAYANAGDVPNAVDSYRRSIAADARQPLAYVNLGIALENQNDLAGAGDAYQRAIAVDPNEAVAYFNLGNVYLKGDKTADAIAQYAKAASLDPSITLANVYLARAYAATGDLSKALAAVRQALAFAPNDEQAKSLEGELMKAGAR
jgi:tetratricopeptide (TPR) repeat protein